MCGILGYKEYGDNELIQKRGQDATTEIYKNGFTFVHNLLSITGEYTEQPFVDGNIVALFNGEIYNLPFKKSDGENIIPLYKKYGYHFPEYLDGEWAIVLFDFDENIAIYSTDLFATKPLWRNGAEFASYESGVWGDKIPANTIQVVDLETEKLIKELSIYDFDFTQHKDSYNDWLVAFSKAVSKRGKDRCFIGLSSGYDSGAIQNELRKQNIKHKSFAVGRNENEEIMLKRKPDETIILSDIEKDRLRGFLLGNMENFKYTVRYNGIETNMTIMDDPASIGLAAICEKAQKEKRKVYLSGQGADEIMSDYKLFPDQNEIQEFPDELSPWYNFYGGCQESYIAKEEHVAGTFNIETRYPFLDKDVVQEFLWLKPGLKNKHYKAPLYKYLTINNVPFEKNIKRGFTP
jgi:asparagine synthetase B (glutamine-hydrolysing)